MAEVVDKLGMQKEFEDAPAPPAEKAPEPEIKKFFREIDLKDGSGVQRFEAETQEGLLDKLAEAHEHASRTIHKLQKDYKELSGGRKPREPERASSDWQEVKPVKLSAEDEATAQAFRRIFQAETGLQPAEFVQQENLRRRQMAEAQAQAEFMRSHPDYNPTQDNAQKIFKFLERENYPVSRRNLDYAYQELQGELEPKPGSVTTDKAPQPPGVPASPTVRPDTRSTPPSFMRPSVGARDEMAGGGQDAEIARIAQSQSLPEMKARIEQYFRQQRSSAR